MLFSVLRVRLYLLIIALLIPLPKLSFAASAPMSTAEPALYQGADRERILIEGAKGEGQFTLYTSHTCRTGKLITVWGLTPN